MRAKIVVALKNEPLNAKQLADHLRINYKTVRHHLKILSNHRFIESFGDKYGKAYTISPALDLNYQTFVEVQRTGLSHGKMVRVLG
ncbi:MAG TPA: winged helix-turn-helix domain-containing protein [Candidatus Binatus sp.]|nr:winged helix-turn-helix domain-containing protein [Candidatus Binatus sp.]